MLQNGVHANGVLAIISAMITPAILILATGSLVASTLTRLGRIVDRARALLRDIAEFRKNGDVVSATHSEFWLLSYRRRSAFAERALTIYYFAIFLFVAASLAIAIDDLTRGIVPWLALSLTVTGAFCLFAGTAALVFETNIATGQIRLEIEAALRPDLQTSELTPPR